MGRYRKLPVVVDAWRMSELIATWMENARTATAREHGMPTKVAVALNDGTILLGQSGATVKTLEGPLWAARTDWLICGVHGEFTPPWRRTTGRASSPPGRGNPDPVRPVVTVTPTIMDGTVVRWYASLADAEAHRPTVSASRNCVLEHLEDVPADWRAAADAAHFAMRFNRHADMSSLATHTKTRFMGPLAPVDVEGGA